MRYKLNSARAPAARTPPMIQSKQDVLLESLRKFFAEHPDHLRLLGDVLCQDHHHHKDRGRHVSLRVLDWLVTNYAKKHNIVYVVANGDGEHATFNMFLEYKSQLKAYSKRFFDPFCRRQRLQFECDGGRTLHTTVGQLNFFRWALQHGVVEYGAANNAAIEDDMLRSIRHRNPKATAAAGGAGRPKRRELSKAAIKGGCTKTALKITVRFS